jgi:hypothetical protein
MDRKHRAFLETHCEKCHGPEKQKGKFRVDELPFRLDSPEGAERWQKILNSLNSGEMPPEEEKQPPKGAKAEFLEALSHTLVDARRALSDLRGQITLRRLNQREYSNTLRELLGVKINVAQLPADGSAGGFDTVGSNLFMSANQIEQYRTLAREALDEAFEALRESQVHKTFRFECEEVLPQVRVQRDRSISPRESALKWERDFQKALALPQNADLVAGLRKSGASDAALRRMWEKIPGAPNLDAFQSVRGDKFAFIENGLLKANQGPTLAEQYFQQPLAESGAYLTLQVLPELHFHPPLNWPVGESTLRVRAGVDAAVAPERRFLEMGPYGGKLTRVLEVSGSLEQPAVMEVPIHLLRRQQGREERTLFIRERGTVDHIEQLLRRTAAEAAGGSASVGPRFGIWVDWIELEHRAVPADQIPRGLAVLGIPAEKADADVTPEILRTAFRNFCLEAFRGAPAEEEYLDGLEGMYRNQRASGQKHLPALKYVLSTVLTSPSFLYLVEPQGDGHRKRLEARELACRLSYFLWGAPPDAELRALAVSGELRDPRVLAVQVERLLGDARVAGWVRPFLHQWWSMDRLDLFQPDWKEYPRFDHATRWGAREEMYETFSYLLRSNGSICDLLKSDYVVVNGLMARYYGLGGVSGDAFRPVKLPVGTTPRGGVLGMAAFSFMGSNGHQTSPVERGAWVLRKLLNEPPPPAPANVPSLNRLEGRLLTARERLLAHQEEPQCASCHRKIDPIGFGLENLDPVGRWREEEKIKATFHPPGSPPQVRKTELRLVPVDASSALHKGPAFTGFQELRGLIAERRDAFARGMSAALVEYALGRPCGFSDEPLLEAMVSHIRERGYGLRDLVRFLTASEDFQSK